MLVFYFSIEFPMPSLITIHGLTSFQLFTSSLFLLAYKNKFLITYMKCLAEVAHSVYVIDI